MASCGGSPKSGASGRHLVRLAPEPLIARLRARAGAANVPGRLVFPKALVNDLTQQPVLRPGQKLDLRHEFGSDPMNAREDERRAEPAPRSAHPSS
jgi:hypothetical protein